MISVMDMTTGLLEREFTAPASRFESGEPAPHLDACQANLALHAGLHEYVTACPRYTGTAVVVAALDMDDFIARMTDSSY